MKLIDPIDYELVDFHFRADPKRESITFSAKNIGVIIWDYNEDKVTISNRTDTFAFRWGTYEEAMQYIKKYMCIDSEPDNQYSHAPLKFILKDAHSEDVLPLPQPNTPQPIESTQSQLF